ncbi:hypothetical protein MMC25_003676 [Agyrium rufum]|nr:hypothetical protein [Agyrium rufum]
MAAPTLLTGPAPVITASRIDWIQEKLPEYNKLYAIVLDNAFAKEECQTLVAAAEKQCDGKWEQALVNVGGGQQALYTDVRNNDRIIWDDRQVVGEIWNRIKDYVPEILVQKDIPWVTGTGPAKREETWVMSRLNERMRFLRYGPKQYFQPHCDGMYETPDGKERSYYTLHLYLNESDPDGPNGALVGGSTSFHSMNMNCESHVKPKVGRVLVFQQRGLLHSGEEVSTGLKLTMRTELMYKKE